MYVNMYSSKFDFINAYIAVYHIGMIYLFRRIDTNHTYSNLEINLEILYALTKDQQKN